MGIEGDLSARPRASAVRLEADGSARASGGLARAPLPSSPKAESPAIALPPSDLDDVAAGRAIAARCSDLRALRDAADAFDGCALKASATRLCFGSGAENADFMLIGEAPGREEDRRGEPFVGPSGALLDAMLAWIGFDRASVWITNLVFWRPVANKTPSSLEVAQCAPFLERQIDLVQPKLIAFLGAAAARAMLGVSEGVTRLRGKRRALERARSAPIPCLVTFHPAFLLRQPLQKRLAWRDMLTLAEMADEMGVRRGPGGALAGARA